MDGLFRIDDYNPTAEAVSGSSRPSLAGEQVVVVGFGSPYGDDQVGWRVVEMLQSRENLPAKVVMAREGIDLVTHLDGCERLIIVDASRSSSPVGSINRLQWSDLAIAEDSRRAMHGMTVSEAMRLARLLGRVPASVEVIAVEIGECAPGCDLSPAVANAAAEVERLIATELCEEAYA